MYKKLLPAVGLMAVSTGSFAAIDPAAIVTEIGLYPAIIGLIGVAVITVALAVKGIKWAKATL